MSALVATLSIPLETVSTLSAFNPNKDNNPAKAVNSFVTALVTAVNTGINNFAKGCITFPIAVFIFVKAGFNWASLPEYVLA